MAILEGAGIPGICRVAQEKDPADVNTYIVRGSSRGGSAKQGTENRKFQAKISSHLEVQLNVEKVHGDTDRIFC